jgi:hypothetical protein
VTGLATSRRLTVYSREGCHLCEVMIEALRMASGGQPIEIVDVDRAPDLIARYGDRVPVLVIDGREICQYRLDEAALRRALSGP